MKYRFCDIITMNKSYKPAIGLKHLTWPQIELIDSLVGTACELTKNEQSGDARVVITVRNGNPRFITIPTLIEWAKKSLELTPTR